jgi:hypothetical protein
MMSFFLVAVSTIVLVVLLAWVVLFATLLLGWHAFTYIWFLISTSVYRLFTGKNPFG